MASILDRYGIKEVADVTFYKIDKETNKPTDPVLYLDTLKVSTIEQTAENTSARGGKGNPELIMWDYGKEITVTLEDALFSAKSMAIMFGSVDKDGKAQLTDQTVVKKTVPKNKVIPGTGTSEGKYFTEIFNKPVEIPASAQWYRADGTTCSAGEKYQAPTESNGNIEILGYSYVTWDMSVIEAKEITISAETFPGTYYVTGDTYARRESDGIDEFFQFIIPKAKIQSEVTLTMEAEGDPSTFSMNLKVLRPADGKMMKLVKYNIDYSATQNADG